MKTDYEDNNTQVGRCNYRPLHAAVRKSLKRHNVGILATFNDNGKQARRISYWLSGVTRSVPSNEEKIKKIVKSIERLIKRHNIQGSVYIKNEGSLYPWTPYKLNIKISHN